MPLIVGKQSIILILNEFEILNFPLDDIESVTLIARLKIKFELLIIFKSPVL